LLAFAFTLAGCASTSGAAVDGVTGKEVSYEVGGVTFNGYLAFDRTQVGQRPGVLVVHEWWGHNEYARKRADMLAGMGYTALALDMYGDGKQASHPADAEKFMLEVFADMDVAVARFAAAQELLQAHPTTDPKRTAAIGYCFGGAVVLHMARSGLDLDGVASFHGNLATESPAAPGVVRASVLVLHGGSDPFVPDEQLAAFRAEMDAAGVDYEVVVYADAKHSFTNPGSTSIGEAEGMPLEYDASADERSWARLDAFLEDVFAR
jgi:dienelactone hydrolase